MRFTVCVRIKFKFLNLVKALAAIRNEPTLALIGGGFCATRTPSLRTSYGKTRESSIVPLFDWYYYPLLHNRAMRAGGNPQALAVSRKLCTARGTCADFNRARPIWP